MSPPPCDVVLGAAIVTGASSGIGAATAVMLANRGYRVCVNHRDSAAAAEALAEGIRDNGGIAISHRADVRDVEAVRQMFDRTTEELGPLCGLVNNAAILERQASYDDIDADRLARVLATNVGGAFNCAKAALDRMCRSRGGQGGAIVNVSSVAARTGSPHEYVDYAMSKGALDTMTVGLAREVAEDGVRVNAVRPGFIHTDLHAKGGEPDRVARLTPKIPLGRGGEPDEVAGAIAWLLSDEASFTTGALIDVGGGI